MPFFHYDFPSVPSEWISFDLFFVVQRQEQKAEQKRNKIEAEFQRYKAMRRKQELREQREMEAVAPQMREVFKNYLTHVLLKQSFSVCLALACKMHETK